MSLNLKSQESNFLPFQELILAYYSLLYIFSFLNSLDVTFLYKKGSFLTSISKYIQKVLQLKILSSIILVLESSDRTGCQILQTWQQSLSSRVLIQSNITSSRLLFSKGIQTISVPTFILQGSRWIRTTLKISKSDLILALIIQVKTQKLIQMD